MSYSVVTLQIRFYCRAAGLEFLPSVGTGSGEHWDGLGPRRMNCGLGLSNKHREAAGTT